jgi:hypothetical protein
LDRPFFQVTGIIVIVLVIVDGAFFFFLLMGWHTLCNTPSRTDCDPRNWWYNFSIQLLNVLFTYMNAVAMPWRSTQWLHISGWGCPYRKNALSHDLYGRVVDNDPWYYIPLGRRWGITTLLLLNAITQFINQGTRIVYYNFDLQNTSPGNIWTNVFFAASFLSAALAGGWMTYEVSILRKTYPQHQFGPGPKELVKAYYEENVTCCGTKTIPKSSSSEDDTKEMKNKNDHNNNDDKEPSEQKAHSVDEEEAGDSRISPTTRPSESFHPDPTREKKHRSIVPVQRSTMRMWAM